MNDMVIYQDQRLTAGEIRANVNLVQEVMQAVMKKDVHYGTIPGTPKPTLYKPGAEVLAATFRIAVSYQVADLSTQDAVRYRVTATGTHQTTGIVMGAGMGECSSGEEKYKWRKAYDEEWNATPEDRKRIKYGKYSAKQVRTEPADLANTVLKMACKRAQVAMTLNVTAASDIFTQDIEDLPEELRHSDEYRETAPPPAAGLQPYPAEQFKKNLPAWTEAIKLGKATPEQIVARASTKGVLSVEQRKQLYAAPKPAPKAEVDSFVAEMENANENV